jgi:hypothetical protein
MNAERSLGAVFSDLLGEFTALFRSEIRLARAEFSEKLGLMGTGIALTAAGSVLLFAALLFLLAAAAGGLMAAGLKLWLASLIVGGATLIVGGAVLWFGLSRFNAKTLAPTKTVHQLQRDAAVAKYQVQTQ